MEDTPKQKLIVVCGLPGSGKTTRAKLLEDKLGAVRLSADDWMADLAVNLHDEPTRARVEALQWKLARRLLELQLTVIIEWGTWGRAERDALRLGARAQGALVELHYLTAPPEVLFERITTRAMEDPPIARATFLDWVQRFEKPSAEEIALFDPATPLAPSHLESKL